MTAWPQRTAVLYVLTEAFAWFIALRAFATAVERQAFRELTEDIAQVVGIGQFANEEQATSALAIASYAAAHATGGPALPLVLAAASGAFLLSRGLTRLGLPAGVGAVIGLLASVVTLQVLIHVALAGDLRVWDGATVAEAFEGSGSFTGGLTREGFIADPDTGRVRTASAALTVVGLTALWVRFLLAGRGTVTFERVLRSFSFGFAVVLVATLVWGGAVGSQSGAALALVYFVLGVLSLAVAHAARAGAGGDVLRREGPWALSVLATMGAVAAVALIFGGLALLDVQRVFEPTARGVFAVVGWVLRLILAPIFWTTSWLLNLILGDAGETQFRNRLSELAGDAQNTDDPAGRRLLPGWAGHAVRVAVVAFVVWLAYRAGRLIFGRVRHGPPETYSEARAESSGGMGLGGMLRGLFPAMPGRGPDPSAWMRRHPIYRLFGRAVVTAEDRGVRRRPGETPLEFASSARTRLGAPLSPIATAFDAARYGRHYPADDEVGDLDRALTEWERAHPAE